MKKTIKILATNWINLLGIFAITFFSVFINSYLTSPASFTQAFYGTCILICYYGIIFWIGFAILLIIFDLIFIIPFKSKIKRMLLLEWLIISLPFIYWTIKYKQWVFLVAIITFFITQMIRERQILKIN